MRWGERAAASRDELDASLFVARQSQREFIKAQLVVKKPVPKPALTGTAFGRNVRPVKAGNVVVNEPFSSSSSSGSTRVEVPIIAVLCGTSQRQQAPSSFLVCAGKSVSSNNDEEPSDISPAVHPESRISALSSSDPVKKAPTQSLQRTDSELELFISELREKISFQHRLDEEKRKAASHKSSETSGNGALDSSRSTGSNSEPHHPRRHLKNPVERVHGNTPQVGSLGLSMTSSSSISLKRQQSSSSVTAGSGTRLAPPTVIVTVIGSCSSSASRANLAASAAANLLHHSSGSILNDRDLEAHSYSRVYDDEGLLIKSYAQDPSSNNNTQTASSNNNTQTASGVQRPIVYHNNVEQRRARLMRRSTPDVEPKAFNLHLEPQRPTGNNSSDSDSSFSDDEDENPFLLQGSLSPVGPWMVANDRQNPDSLDSLDSSHPGSTGLDLSPTSARTAAEDKFTELSPRSRLLWLSEFADTVEYSSESFGSSALRQCQSHPGTLRPSSAGAKTSGSKPPVRCSSAKPSSQGRRGVVSNSESNGTKDKSGGTLSRKQPQSGGSRVRKAAS